MLNQIKQLFRLKDSNHQPHTTQDQVIQNQLCRDYMFVNEQIAILEAQKQKLREKLDTYLDVDNSQPDSVSTNLFVFGRSLKQKADYKQACLDAKIQAPKKKYTEFFLKMVNK